MKNRLFVCLGILLLSALLALSVCAAGDKTLVYLKDGGSGDGSSPDAALGSMKDVYDALDLSKDCTAVVCGTLTTPKERIAFSGDYAGTVTYTSVYGGTDYRTSGAKIVFMPYAYAFSCGTAFENVDL
ncbi:MAG: hypothetical protein IJU41_07345, partial [Clostridia bacterium]|nr:hypothetical protein [Clostridia bacterium]